MSQGCDLCSLK